MQRKKKSVHFRRCHICDEVTSRSGQIVERCKGCGKAFARFYYFDEFSVPAYSDKLVRTPLFSSGEPLGEERRALEGITAAW